MYVPSLPVSRRVTVIFSRVTFEASSRVVSRRASSLLVSHWFAFLPPVTSLTSRWLLSDKCCALLSLTRTVLIFVVDNSPSQEFYLPAVPDKGR